MKRGTTMERHQFIPRNFQGIEPEPPRTNMDHSEDVMMILTDF